mmetsp:Transcript_9927/g.18983  ORF Transcript_9927/g.18983 Transcript_9927/m.18983 type:complete len:260 (-) Transcript_9927:403-1182(-)
MSSALPEHQVPHAMSKFDAAVLELGQRAVGRLVSIAGRGVQQRGLGRQHLQHLLGIGLPVSRAVQIAAGGQVLHQLGNELRLDQPALVVALLVPGVGEEDVHTGQHARADHVAQHLDRVVLDDADVGDLLLVDELEQRADAGLMHLAADEVVVRQGLGDLGGGAAHAKADLQHQRRLAAEHLGRVEALRLVGQHELGAEFGQRLDLAGAHAAGAGDKALDRAAGRVLRRVAVLFCHQPIVAMTSGVAATSASPSPTAAR